MTQPISKVAWKKHIKAVTDEAVSASNNSKKYLVSNTSYTCKDELLEKVTEVSVSVDDSWGPRRFLLGQVLADTYSEETERVIDVTLKTNYFMAGSNIKAQKDAGTINPLEYL